MQTVKKFLIFILGTIVGYSSLYIYQAYNSLQVLGVPVELQTQRVLDEIRTTVSNNISYGKDNNYGRFDEIYRVLVNEFYHEEDVDKEKMTIAAIKSFVSALGDPYTVYLDNKENNELQEALKGSQDFEGIGAYVSKTELGIRVDEIIKGGAAHKADILPLDIIVQVAGQNTQALSLSEGVALIRGPEGSEVTLKILRTVSSEEKELLDFTVTREKIHLESVVVEREEIEGYKIATIEISSIGDDTANIFASYAKGLKEENIEGIILDLRGNGGGFLDVAVDIASHMIPKGKLIVRSDHKAYKGEEYTSQGFGTLEGLPIVVLIDGLTASAGEIIAMALNEILGSPVIGSQSFGKGTIQTIKSFSDSSSLKYTIGKRFSPLNNNISGTGFAPTIIVDFDKEQYDIDRSDNQQKKAIDTLVDQIKNK